MRDSSGLIEVFRSKAAVGIGNWVLVEGYRHLTVSLDFDGSANMTVKCVGSIGKGGATTAKDIDDAPNPLVAQTDENCYDYVEMIDLNSGSDIDGDTGIAKAGAGDHRNLNVNTDGLKWVNFYITARSAGAATARVKLFRD